MAIDLSNIFSGGDIYNTVLRDVLGVHPTGDPVADSVYLLVLPLLTLYLFSDHVSKLLHVGHSKLKWVFMAIVFFFVINSGYYPVLADYAMFAFIALLIWGAWTFITGPKDKESGSAHPNDMKVYNMDVGGNKGSFLSRVGQFAKVTDHNDILRGLKQGTNADLRELERMKDRYLKEGKIREAKDIDEMIFRRKASAS